MSTVNGLPPAVQMLCWSPPPLHKLKCNKFSVEWQGDKKIEHPNSRQPSADSPPPDSTDSQISAFFNVTSTASRDRYCENTRPQNQLNAAKEQHKDLCIILQRASVTLRTILLRVGGTFYYLTRWSLLRSWVLILKAL